jgi:hypothetical protein
MSKGQIVTVKLYGGQTAKRRVAAVKRDVVVVCAEEEYQEAIRDGREPNGLGFPKEDVIDSELNRKGASSELPAYHERSKAGD